MMEMGVQQCARVKLALSRETALPTLGRWNRFEGRLFCVKHFLCFGCLLNEW
jgi:hypothetical protein